MSLTSHLAVQAVRCNPRQLVKHARSHLLRSLLWFPRTVFPGNSISRQERSAMLDSFGLAEKEMPQYSCMIVNIKSPQRVQFVFRALDLVHEDIQRSWVIGLSLVALPRRVAQGGNLSSTHKWPCSRPYQKFSLCRLHTCSALNSSPRLRYRYVINSAAGDAGWSDPCGMLTTCPGLFERGGPQSE